MSNKLNIKPHHRGFVGRLAILGKKASPLITKTLMQEPLDGAISYLSMYLEMIQGKGAGPGWDLRSEINVALANIHRQNAIIFDLGAHQGTWSDGILKSLGTQPHIYQFEPEEKNIKRLKEKQLGNITIIDAAVSDKSGTDVLHVPDDGGSTISSLWKRRESIFQEHNYQEKLITTITIDEVVNRFNIDTIDFMKMDIEGHEFAALLGAKETLKSRKIKALTFEFGSGNINSRTFFHDFWDLLNPLGYKINRICPGGVIFPIKQYYEDLEYFRGATNYLAVFE